MYEIYCKLRDTRKCKDADVSKATGITKSTFSDWKSGRSEPKKEKLQKIADYFNVPLEYLMTGEEEKWKPSLTDHDEKDIARRLEKTLEDLENDHDGLMFSGEPLDDETKELLRISLENSIRLAKVTAKEKFTPNKYKK